MNGDKWTRIDRTLHSALALRKHEREAFVRDACKDDDGVRDEVLSLLKHAESADGFLETRSVREPLVSGFRLGEYEIESQLGAGGMGEVYRARDLRLKRDVALKILPPDAADPERRRRFTREAQAVAALNHPGIVTIHSVEESGGIQFLTMELVEGKTLDALIPPAGLAIEVPRDRRSSG
jgi:serine/threonine protein kinase